MLNFKKKKEVTTEDINILLGEHRKLTYLLEQNRVLGIAENDHKLKSRLENIQSFLEKENVNIETENIPFGGIEIDGGDLKDKTTEELLRIQTVQLQKLIEKHSNFLIETQKSNSKLLYYTEKIYNNVLFWFWLTILSIIVGLIAVIFMNT